MIEDSGPTLGVDEPIERILLPFQRLLRAEATGGLILLGCTVLALGFANSPWQSSFAEFWQTKLTIGLGDFKLSKSLLVWINDALMSIFFFVVGLEIKREILVGELASFRKAALPIAAAIGGMLVPATIYASLNVGTPAASGWGVPMATDIAFALGILALLGNRVPLSGKIFLTALAIVDDMGAALVIAIFYTDQISWLMLGIGGGFFLAMLISNRMGVRSTIAYSVLGLGLWFCFLKSGVHPTISGVIAAFSIPARVRINAEVFLERSRACLASFESSGATGASVLTNKQQRGALMAIEKACQQAEAPSQRLEHMLHPWVAFLIMPIFALANAGVTFQSETVTAMGTPLALGVMGGLVLGKPIGIIFCSWLVVWLGIAKLPDDLNWGQICGIGLLSGVGFTMSLFIAGLAFGDSELLSIAKLGILCASLVAGLGGWLVLRFAVNANAATSPG